MSRKPEKSFGAEIVEELSELRNTLERGERVDHKYTVKTVELDLQPRQYEADDVRQVRQSLNVSQAVFAQILAASPESVESWEQGLRKPSPMACRLLDLIQRHRDHWVKVLHDSAARMQGEELASA